ncbi:response regulator [Paraburkholderia azotifigens]|uniref:Response regulator n=1 Tax=Paraburkholderia azotifigens TaxID=2057004 RepID=A0A5C6W0K8_9BURK|nr:response regulator [Paraburkholderia azotifigens]TXC89218.1 response regulator [Paraburkholderia azotifigens]
MKCARSGEEAFCIIESFAPDVALIDLHMPGMDGTELARRLRQQAAYGATGLVALTCCARPDEHTKNECAFDRYLVKPPSLEDLAEVLRRWAVTASYRSRPQQPQCDGMAGASVGRMSVRTRYPGFFPRNPAW